MTTPPRRPLAVRCAASAVAVAALVAAAAGPIEAQSGTGGSEIRTGQTVSGRLTKTDPRFEDGSHYDLYTYRGREGETLRITLRSADFDAFLYFGRPAGPDCEHLCRENDDAGGGTDSRIRVTLDSDGEYQIVVNSLHAGEIGAYTLTVEEVEQRTFPEQRIAIGGVARGELTDEHPVLEDGSHFALYRIQARLGERIRITLRSDDFDAYLHFGLASDAECAGCFTDDDGAQEGTNARIDAVIDADGDYLIVVNTLMAGETGRYELSIETAPPRERIGKPGPPPRRGAGTNVTRRAATRG